MDVQMKRRFALGALTAVALLILATRASAITYAPLDHPGPPLGPALAALQHSVACTSDVSHATREPVLLLGATGVNTTQNYGYNYEKAFNAARIPYCTSDEPGALASNMDDIQLRGEYVTYAIRRVHQLAEAADRGARPQPGRDGHALVAALLARHPADGRRRDRHGGLQPRHRRLGRVR